MHWPNTFDARDYKHQLSPLKPLWNWYTDENASARISIPSKIINSNFLNVKCQYWAEDDQIIDLLEQPVKNRFFSNILQLSINDSVYTSIEWFPFIDNEKRSVEAMIPIQHLLSGKHILTIENILDITTKAKILKLNVRKIEIIFWKN